jgi:hypothetical protein
MKAGADIHDLPDLDLVISMLSDFARIGHSHSDCIRAMELLLSYANSQDIHVLESIQVHCDPDWWDEMYSLALARDEDLGTPLQAALDALSAGGARGENDR